MATIAKLHAAKQPPIPLKPFVEYHHHPTTHVTTQFEVVTTATVTRTVTQKHDLPLAPYPSDYKRHGPDPGVAKWYPARKKFVRIFLS